MGSEGSVGVPKPCCVQRKQLGVVGVQRGGQTLSDVIVQNIAVPPRSFLLDSLAEQRA